VLAIQIPKEIKIVLAALVILTMLFATLPSSQVNAEEDGLTIEDTIPIEDDPPVLVDDLVIDDTPNVVVEEESTVEEVPPKEETITVVETGDAVAVSDTTNEVNTNVTDTEAEDGGAGTTTPEIIVPEEDPSTDAQDEGMATTTPPVIVPEEEVATTTPSVIGTENEEEAASSTPPTDITIENENDAEVDNIEGIDAETGENEANNNSNTIIETGDAIAVANVINVVNTNIVNSDGFLVFLSNLFGTEGLYDLRKWFVDGGEGGGCDLEACDGSNTTLNVNNDNNATINNTVVVRSSTGGNESNNNDGSAVIVTGNAYAAANVINVANTNIVDSTYLLLNLNNFGDLSENLVLPSRNFFERVFNRGSSVAQRGTSVVNNNRANIENRIGVVADTGGNEANGNGGISSILTGDVNSSASVTNVVNTNILNTDSFNLLIRVHGNWTGSIFGLPDGINWERTPFGVRLFNNPEIEDGEGGNGYESLNVENNNTASISNNISVFALTGENEVNNNGGAGVIDTGNAYAAANVTNVVNTNIIGRNWMLGMINIFGDWNGNLSFGQPDLWIGADVVSDGPVMAGSQLTYYFTIVNRGDAIATNITLTNVFDFPYLHFNGGNETDSASRTMWDIGDLQPGESMELIVEAFVDDNLNARRRTLTSTVTLVSTEDDANVLDNTDIIAIVASALPGTYGSGGLSVSYEMPPDLSIVKTNNTDGEIMASSTVDYEIVVENNGEGPAFSTMLYDELTNDAGDVINMEAWDLGDILPGEVITLTYTTEYNASTTSGVYTNSAYIEGYYGTRFVVPFYGSYLKTDAATSTVIIVGETSSAAVHEENEEDEEEEDTIEAVVTSIIRGILPPVKVATVHAAAFDSFTLPPSVGDNSNGNRGLIAGVFASTILPFWHMWLLLLILLLIALLPEAFRDGEADVTI